MTEQAVPDEPDAEASGRQATSIFSSYRMMSEKGELQEIGFGKDAPA
jgi:hypothetical protein